MTEITAIISGEKSNIRTLESRPDGINGRISASIDIADRRQLERILANIEKVAGVYGVERVFHA